MAPLRKLQGVMFRDTQSSDDCRNRCRRLKRVVNLQRKDEEDGDSGGDDSGNDSGTGTEEEEEDKDHQRDSNSPKLSTNTSKEPATTSTPLTFASKSSTTTGDVQTATITPTNSQGTPEITSPTSASTSGTSQISSSSTSSASTTSPAATSPSSQTTTSSSSPNTASVAVIPSSSVEATNARRLNEGQIAGIVIGAITLTLALLGAIVFILRSLRRRRAKDLQWVPAIDKAPLVRVPRDPRGTENWDNRTSIGTTEILEWRLGPKVEHM